jgi:hypothetical protein
MDSPPASLESQRAEELIFSFAADPPNKPADRKGGK